MIQAQHHNRKANHPYSERSKAPSCNIAPSTHIEVGYLVYLYSGRARIRYLVTSIEVQWCYIRKFVGSQLRSTSYRVKKTECYKVPSQVAPNPYSTARPGSENISDEDDPDCATPAAPPAPPFIPPELSTPATDPMNTNDSTPESMGTSDIPEEPPMTNTTPSGSTPEAATLRRSSRQRNFPQHLNDLLASSSIYHVY